MNEQSKAAFRRFNDGSFLSKYFVGNGIDIGGKPDPLAQYVGIFPLMKSVFTWDIEHGDAQYMKGVKDESFDFVASSHCLEHMVDVNIALDNWIRIVKKGGYLVITVPDEDLYELGNWPSKFNPDHKHSFTIYKEKSLMPKSINVLDLVKSFSSKIEVHRVVLLDGMYRNSLKQKGVDQTLTPVAECAIEIILKKI